jgi:hypothetical protein
MKAKPPFQIIIMDDNGTEVFSEYVALNNNDNHTSLLNHRQAEILVHDMAKAISKTTVDKDAPRWTAM